MATINRDTVAQDQIRRKQALLAEAQKRGLLGGGSPLNSNLNTTGRLGTALQNIANPFLQMGGINPPAVVQPQGSDLNAVLQKARIERELEMLYPSATDRLAQIRLEEIERQRMGNTPNISQAEQPSMSGTIPQETVSQETDQAYPESTPTGQQYIRVFKGYDEYGIPQYDIKTDTISQAREEAKIQTQKEVESARKKAQLTTQQDLTNASLKIDNTLDSFFDVAKRTYELSGVKPGPVAGVITKVLGETKANEFYSGFSGGLVEYASAIGRISIPGARATRLIGLFKKTAPTTFDTIESGIQTSADSFRSALSTDMSRNPDEYIPGYSKMSKEQQLEANKQLSAQLRMFEEKYKYGMLTKIWSKDRDMLKPETVAEIERKISYDPKNKTFAYRLSDGTYQEIQ